jgi:hypothetical protein
MVLNTSLNETYIAYNARGATRKGLQSEMDQKQMEVDKKSGYARMKVKGNAATYNNKEWDMVDRYAADTSEVRSISDPNKISEYIVTRALPDSLRGKTVEEVQKFIVAKKQERDKISNEIMELVNKRELFIAEEKKRIAAAANQATLENDVEKAIRAQVKNVGMFVR